MALPPGKTIKEVYGKDVDVNAPLKVSPLVKAQVKALEEGTKFPTSVSRESDRPNKGKPAKKLEDESEGGRRRRTRRRARKHKKTRRHHRKH
jgi:hypothetical protein